MEAEPALIRLLHYSVVVIEGVGAVIIIVAAVLAVVEMGKALLGRAPTEALDSLRLHLARRLVLALEFLIAADILASLHTPDLQEVVLLAVIIIVRTVMSLSIAYEIRHAGGKS